MTKDAKDMADTEVTMFLKAMYREVGEDILSGIARELFNSLEARCDADGSVWIDKPMRGHWIDAEQRRTLVKFIQDGH